MRRLLIGLSSNRADIHDRALLYAIEPDFSICGGPTGTKAKGKEAIMRRAGMDLRREAAQGASRIRAGFLAGETGVPTTLYPFTPTSQILAPAFSSVIKYTF
jgi:hypothetical protein